MKPVNGAGQENAVADPTILHLICAATVEFNGNLVDLLLDVVGLGHTMQHITCVAEEIFNLNQDYFLQDAVVLGRTMQGSIVVAMAA